MHKNVSAEVAKTYTFVTEVIINTVEMVNRIAVSSGKSEPKVTGAALCGAER